MPIERLEKCPRCNAPAGSCGCAQTLSGKPFPSLRPGGEPTGEMLALAERAAANRDKPPADLDAWAKRLAADSVAAGECETVPSLRPGGEPRVLDWLAKASHLSGCSAYKPNHRYRYKCSCGLSQLCAALTAADAAAAALPPCPGITVESIMHRHADFVIHHCPTCRDHP